MLYQSPSKMKPPWVDWGSFGSPTTYKPPSPSKLSWLWLFSTIIEPFHWVNLGHSRSFGVKIGWYKEIWNQVVRVRPEVNGPKGQNPQSREVMVVCVKVDGPFSKMGSPYQTCQFDNTTQFRMFSGVLNQDRPLSIVSEVDTILLTTHNKWKWPDLW